MDYMKSGLMYIGSKMWRYQSVAGLLISAIYFLSRFIPSHNEGLATRPADEPTTIAKNGSHVYDIYRGELFLRDLAVFNADMALVFYYAPWSKESMDTFKEYEAAADVMYKQVSFIAVNCWYIKGSCRGKLQFQDFPHIFLHHKNMKQAVHYNGQLKRNYFTHFLKKAIMPVHYISTIQDGKRLVDENQFAAVASFKAEHTDLHNDFQRFVIIATRLLEYSVLQIEFGVIVNAEVARLLFMKPRILYLHNKMNPNEPHEISLKNTTDEIVQYLAGFWKDTVSRDLTFPWNRANYLHESLNKGPLLAVFVSSPSIAERYHYVQKIRQLAIAFNSHRKESGANYSSIYAKTTRSGRCCKTYIFERKSPPVACSVCFQEAREIKSRMCYDVDELLTGGTAGSVILPAFASIHKRIAISPDNVHCSQVQIFYGMNYHYANICCQRKCLFFQNMFESTAKSNVTWKSEARETLKKRVLVDNYIASHILAEQYDVSEVMDASIIRGLAELMNKTLQFAILDFDHHNALALNLGISESYIYIQNGTKFGSAILDLEEEKNYVMKSIEFNLEKFIVHFYLGLLPEHLHSAKHVSKCVLTDSEPCVHEVTTSTFEKMVLNSKKNVLLIYYLPWCLACTSISHNYLYVSDILQGSSTVLVARIDASTNKLPLPFRVQKYPAVILYPANRSSYSVVFPIDHEINVPNLLSFLLKNLSQHDIKLLLLDICIHAKGYPEIQHAACENYKIFQRERSL